MIIDFWGVAPFIVTDSDVSKEQFVYTVVACYCTNVERHIPHSATSGHVRLCQIGKLDSFRIIFFTLNYMLFTSETSIQMFRNLQHLIPEN
jgi:hypothetical protein